jgi:hypothetical protein
VALQQLGGIHGRGHRWAEPTTLGRGPLRFSLFDLHSGAASSVLIEVAPGFYSGNV